MPASRPSEITVQDRIAAVEPLSEEMRGRENCHSGRNAIIHSALEGEKHETTRKPVQRGDAKA
jgi:hypothetical protein